MQKLKPIVTRRIENLSDFMPQGKYCGKTILQIIEDDPQYANWMMNEMRTIQFSTVVKDRIRTELLERQ